MRIPARTLAIVAVCVLSGVACGKASDGANTAAPTTTQVTQLPAPQGPPVLEISGTPSAPVRVDYQTLDGLADETHDIFEPFEKKKIAFKGVDLWTVLQGAGVPATAESVHLTALDDYSIDLSIEDLKKGGIILATQANGSPIPLDQGGPTRVVFLDGVAAGANPDQWIWSVSTIDVR